VIQGLADEARYHIYTLEDPIEYRLRSTRSLIRQVEVGQNAQVPTFAEGMRGVLRSDPDLVMCGEMRDLETMAAAIEMAEQGRLVLSTVHTRDASSTPDRVIGAFGDKASQIRMSLANGLLAVIVMTLVPRKDGTGRVAASEVMIATDAIRDMIRESETKSIRNAIMTGRKDGMQTLEDDLSRLVYTEELVTLEEAQRVAIRPDSIRKPESAELPINGERRGIGSVRPGYRV
jgi:twitching motility protein PilT